MLIQVVSWLRTNPAVALRSSSVNATVSKKSSSTRTNLWPKYRKLAVVPSFDSQAYNQPTMSSTTTPKKILIIGGGIAGVTAIYHLRKVIPQAELLLVEPKDFCELHFAAYRSPFEPWVRDGSLIDLAAHCTKYNVQHLRTTVQELTVDTAVLKDGTKVQFDAAIVAVGASIPWEGLGNGLPVHYDGSMKGRVEQIEKVGKDLLNSNATIVVGGGLIGCELAGDIKAYAKDQGKDVQVTLVHSGDHLIAEFPEAAARMVEKKLKKLGVEVILNDKAVENEKGELMLMSDSNKVLQADHIIKVVGLQSNLTGFIKIDDALNSKGFVETDHAFRVKNSNSKVFSFGDCSTQLPNAANQLMEYGKDLAYNVKLAVTSAKDNTGSKSAWREVNVSSPPITVCTVGNKDGVALTPYFHTQLVLPALKNRTMFYFSKSKMGV